MFLFSTVLPALRLPEPDPGPPGGASPASPWTRDEVRDAPDPVLAVLRQSERASAQAALRGEVAFLMDPDHRAFVAFRTHLAALVAPGDPVGPGWEAQGLIADFVDLARAGGRVPVVEHARPDHLEAYARHGLAARRTAEEAVVDLNHFRTDPSHLPELHETIELLEAQGATVDVFPASWVGSVLPELRSIAEDWFFRPSHGPDPFGCHGFDAAYLCQTPVALVCLRGRPVAFANLWVAREGSEVAVDLLCHTADAPDELPTYLVAKLMLWARSRGYSRFSLGFEPAPGDEASRLRRTVAGRFRRTVPGTSGPDPSSRVFKDRFRPHWEPRFTVLPRTRLKGVWGRLALATLT